MPGVTRKTKQKPAVEASPEKVDKKFISESLQNKKPKKGSQKKKTPKHRRRGVVYIKHLPHGFYEDQLRGYFSQFGAITRLRLARSPKTLGSKGYAFIEFRYPEVAEIAADAMNNYIMFKNIIKTRYIQPNDIRHDYFRSGVKKVKKDGQKVLTSKAVEAREAVILNHNKLMTEDDEISRTKKIGARISKQNQKMAALGIDYDVDEVAKNMGEEVMEAAEKAKKTTIADLKEAESSDEADNTFDPESLDIDSGDEFDDFEYNSEHSDDDDDDDENTEEKIDTEKLQNAIKIAREATKTAKIDAPKEAETKVDKRKQTPQQEVPAKKSKKAVKEVEAPKVAEKVSKRQANKKATVNVEEPVKEVPAKKGKKANKKPVEIPAAVEVSTKKTVGKKEAVKPAAVAAPAPKINKKGKAQVEAVSASVPEQTLKGKKGKAVAAPVTPAAQADSKRASKRAVPQPTQESPVAPPKTKKLAKAGIEKKKPAPKIDNKKMKMMAASATTSTEAAETVKVVKAKAIKGKKVAAKK